MNCDWAEPKDIVKASDLTASDRALQTFLGWFAHPVYVNGDYPEVMKQQVANASASEGRSSSRLPEFTQRQKEKIARQFRFVTTIVCVVICLFHGRVEGGGAGGGGGGHVHGVCVCVCECVLLVLLPVKRLEDPPRWELQKSPLLLLLSVVDVVVVVIISVVSLAVPFFIAAVADVIFFVVVFAATSVSSILAFVLGK